MNAKPRASNHRKFLWVLRVILPIVVLSAWMLLARPQALGGPITYVGVSGDSMLPAFASGDLVIIERRNSYSVGDAVVYRVPEGEIGAGRSVVHRIVGGNSRIGYEMKGDNNDYVDGWHPESGQIVGRVAIRIPAAATIMGAISRPVVLGCVIGLIAFAVLVLPDRKRRVRAKDAFLHRR